jgi:hypothetical protein
MSAVENVLFLRGLRCPPDDCGPFPVVWRRSQSPITEYVPDPELLATHANYHELTWGGSIRETVMPALTATSALVGAVVLLGVWSGRWWGRRRKRALDAKAHNFHASRDG